MEVHLEYPCLVMGWEDPQRDCVFADSRDQLVQALIQLFGQDDFTTELADEIESFQYGYDEAYYTTTLGECCNVMVIPNCYIMGLTQPSEEE